MSTPVATAPPRRQRQKGRAVSATEAQNNFGRVLSQAMAEGTVFITKYDRPAAAVVSIERYHELTGEDDPNLEDLTREFEELVAEMQSDESAAAVDALFEMSSEELGRAAAEYARARLESD